jgi:hypothetical protein
MNQDFINRKMDHYNQWLKRQDRGDTYPGFPEEIELLKARKQLQEEFAKRKRK